MANKTVEINGKGGANLTISISDTNTHKYNIKFMRIFNHLDDRKNIIMNEVDISDIIKLNSALSKIIEDHEE